MRMYKYSDVLMSIVAQHFLIFRNIILSIIIIKLTKENFKRIRKNDFLFTFYYYFSKTFRFQINNNYNNLNIIIIIIIIIIYEYVYKYIYNMNVLLIKRK